MYLALFCSINSCIVDCDALKRNKGNTNADSHLKVKRRRSFSVGRFKPTRTNCLLHLKSGPGRDGPSTALFWLAAEQIDIPPTSM